MNFLSIYELAITILFININFIRTEFNGIYKIISYSNNKFFKIFKLNSLFICLLYTRII